ncbi:MAG: hypothetical protein IJR63_10700 [Synergistaceae bacterium]|nr:hypothetical protein [Synergistaceae bacterium]
MNDPRSQGLYPKETIASLLNISERRVEQLVKKRVIPKAGRGVFDLGQTVSAYIRYLQGLCQGSLRESEPSELDRRLMEARVLERESKARQAKYRADMMEHDMQDSRLRSEVRKLPEKLRPLVSDYDSRLVELVMIELEALIGEILGDAT